MLRTLLFTLLVLPLTHRPLLAAEWIVSPDGNDTSGTGTIQSPYKTIRHVINKKASPGDTITLRSGIYREEVSINIPQITLRSKPGEWAKIDLPPSIDSKSAPIGVFFKLLSDDSKLQRLEISGGFHAVGLFSAWNWDSTPLDNDTATDILIEDCIIHDSGRDCIKIPAGCDNITIRRCEIYNSGVGYPPGTPNADKNAEGIDVVNSDNVLIQDCYIHDIATTGIYIKGGSKNSIIERVFVTNCLGMGIGVGFDTSPDFFDTTANPRYYENIGGIVRNCIITNTNYAGIGLYSSKNAVVHNNTLVNTAKQGHSCLFFGLSYQDWENHPGRPPNSNPRILNNIILQKDPIDTPIISIRYANDLGGMSALEKNPIMNNNCYFKKFGRCVFEDERPGSLLENGSLDQWKAHIANEYQSFEKSPRINRQHHLLPDSPCRGAGNGKLLRKIPATDKTQPPRVIHKIIDIGAYEYSHFNPGIQQE